MKRERECLTLEDWRIRAMELEAQWSRCSADCARIQGERDALRAEIAAETQGEPVLWYRDFGAGPMLCAADHPDARPLYAHPPQQRKPLTHSVISGALFDFAGFLATRDKVTPFGSTADAGPIVDLLTEWAKKRGLVLTEADVADWSHGIGETP